MPSLSAHRSFAGKAKPPFAWLAVFALAASGIVPLCAIAFTAARGSSDSAAAYVTLLASLLDPRTLRAISFTLYQASLSTLAALAIGLPGAFLVARYRFPGKRLIKAISVLPFSMPPLIVVLAFVLYYGKDGWANRSLMALFGLSHPPLDFLYSLFGIVLIHGFYNFPIILHNISSVLERMPRDREEAARMLGAGRIRAFTTGSLPSLLPAIVQASSLTFLFCFFSFAVVLVFGGLVGSTLEVEVYRLARIEGNPGGAATLALVETVLAMLLVAIAGIAEGRNPPAKKVGAEVPVRKPRGLALIALSIYGLFLALFFAGPLLSLAIEAFTDRTGAGSLFGFGVGNFARLFSNSTLPRSILDTLASSIPAAIFSLGAGALAAIGLSSGSSLHRSLASFPLAVSGIVSALGWALLFPRGGTVLVIPALAIAAMPFVAKSVAGALASIDQKPYSAARILGAGRIQARLDITLPAIAPSLAAGGAFAFAIAVGDLNAPLVLGGGSFEPLPVLLYRLSSSYRFSEACAVGFLMGILSAAAFFIREGKND